MVQSVDVVVVVVVVIVVVVVVVVVMISCYNLGISNVFDGV